MNLHRQASDRPPPYTQSPLSESSLKLPPLPNLGSSDRPVQLPSIDHLTPKLPPSLDSDNVNGRPLSSHVIHTQTGPILQPLNLSKPSSRETESSVVLSESGSRAMGAQDPYPKRDQSVSMDDPDDRMAAEALCGLGKVSSARSERTVSGYDSSLQYFPIGLEQSRPATSREEPEPLLTLLTSSRPWLAGAINQSISAYSSTKSHSPRFIQYGANFVERNIGSPMASTVGSVGRKTGVEGSLRRYLGSQRSSGELDRIDPEILGQEVPTKRRKISDDQTDVEVEGMALKRTSSGHASIDTLPVYDDNRSPAYEASDMVVATTDRGDAHIKSHQRIHPVVRSWPSQLMISTSGLGAALNEASLRSLKYCLTILRSANSHVSNLMDTLKKILSDYRSGRSSSHHLEEGASDSPAGQTQLSGSLTERIQKLNAEILQTFKSVVDTVSRHTGGALPENASKFVKDQLLSMPVRWYRLRPSQSSEDGASAEQEAVTSAHKMLAFAIEGIDMMEQVGGVVDSTIVSAERWLESMGKKQKGEDEPVDSTSHVEAMPRPSNEDTPMVGTQAAAKPTEDNMSIDTAM